MSNSEYPKFISAVDLNWRGVLKGVSKAVDPLQPLYEAFTNSMEAIELRKSRGDKFIPNIMVDFYFNADMEGENADLSKMDITDNGVGFDDENFKRLQIFKDESKGFNNRGSGRLQLLHSFLTAKYERTFLQDGNIKKRCFILSKGEAFVEKNSILQLLSEDKCEAGTEIRTRLTLRDLRENADIKFYKEKTIEEIKEALINHYIMQFIFIFALII